MKVRGEFHCYHCGYTAATVEMPEGLGSKVVLLVPASNGPGIRRLPGQPPRCGRCGGPLFLAELETVPKVIAQAAVEAARPGRPRKVVGLA